MNCWRKCQLKRVFARLHWLVVISCSSYSFYLFALSLFVIADYFLTFTAQNSDVTLKYVAELRNEKASLEVLLLWLKLVRLSKNSVLKCHSLCLILRRNLKFWKHRIKNLKNTEEETEVSGKRRMVTRQVAFQFQHFQSINSLFCRTFTPWMLL